LKHKWGLENYLEVCTRMREVECVAKNRDIETVREKERI
jgi:hypothetical protein